MGQRKMILKKYVIVRFWTYC